VITGAVGRADKQTERHPIHFAVIGVTSLAFGLVAAPDGICLPIAGTPGEIPLARALKDVAIILLLVICRKREYRYALS
jgi:TRAP-type C4-dicarboxylate transport system permease large subunit